MPRTTDAGRLAERLATVKPQELHDAIVDAAISALRAGAPVEQLDGLQCWTMSDLAVRMVDTRSQRLAQLRDDLEAARCAYDQARRNANTTRHDRLRADYQGDAEREATRIEALEAALAAELAHPATRAEPATFDSECDVIAHAIAGLARFGERAPAEYIDALSHVLEITGLRTVPDADPPHVEVTFCLLLPAAGNVARFGPITCRVRNRAYRNTLRDNGATQRARGLLNDLLGGDDAVDLDAEPHRAVDALAGLLVDQAGWTSLAARTLARSGLPPLYRVAAHILWDEDLPCDLDAAYATMVEEIYGRQAFAWDRRVHAVDCRLRQACVDAVVAAGGHLPYVALEAAVADVGVDDVRITIYSRPQTCGRAPTWQPCLERRDDWTQQRPKTVRSLAAIACPHCGGFASRVVRTPETPACLLCPDCLRMPTENSPVFPALYLAL